MFQQYEICAFAGGIGVGRSRVTFRAEMRRIDIRWTACQNKGIEIFRVAFQFLGRERQRQQHRFAARAFDSAQIVVNFRSPICCFFRGGAPGNADSWNSIPLFTHKSSNPSTASAAQQRGYDRASAFLELDLLPA